MALDGFGKAAMLDPEWGDPKEEQRKLENYLQNTKEYIEEKVNIQLLLTMSICNKKHSDPSCIKQLIELAPI